MRPIWPQKFSCFLMMMGPELSRRCGCRNSLTTPTRSTTCCGSACTASDHRVPAAPQPRTPLAACPHPPTDTACLSHDGELATEAAVSLPSRSSGTWSSGDCVAGVVGAGRSPGEPLSSGQPRSQSGVLMPVTRTRTRPTISAIQLLGLRAARYWRGAAGRARHCCDHVRAACCARGARSTAWAASPTGAGGVPARCGVSAAGWRSRSGR
jgi:hypothetical protein